eukprot:7389381-Prymnesium_polylepis.2
MLGGIPLVLQAVEGGFGSMCSLSTFFWGAWTAVQVLQRTTTAFSPVMHVGAFAGMRWQLRPCLIEDEGGTPLIDLFAMRSFASQPVLVSKLLLMFVNATFVSLGLLVLHYRKKSADDFVAAPAAARGDRALLVCALGAEWHLLCADAAVGAGLSCGCGAVSACVSVQQFIHDKTYKVLWL